MLFEYKVQVLFRSPLAGVTDFRCSRVEPKRLLDEEAMGRPVVLFPRRGTFFRHGPEHARFVDPNDVIFFNPREPFRISYPGSAGDDSTMFSIEPVVLREILAAHGSPLADAAEVRFPVQQTLSSPDLFLAHERLFREACGGAGVLPIEEGVLRLVGQVVAGTSTGSSPRPGRVRAQTLRAHRECAENVKAILAARFREQLTLSDLSRAAGASPYHLCRLFTREVGTSVHRYLNRLRLRDALRRLPDIGDNIVELALDLGYSSHSHFTDAFRREFGMTPTAFRAGATQVPDVHR
jgi:AraC-like DNA-binding protein